MERSRLELARKIDALADGGRATVTESRTELAVYQLDGPDAREIVDSLAPAGFLLSRLADEGGDLRLDQLDHDAIGIELVATKPDVPDYVLPVLTLAGFRAVLNRVPVEQVVWVQGLDRRVETVTVSYRQWGDDDLPFVPQEELPDPARVVRFLVDGGAAEQIGHWLLRDPDTEVSGRVLAAWRMRAIEVLTRALAQEIERDGRLLFRGPPPTRFRGSGSARVEVASLAALQRTTGWVYENRRELENRHGLVAAEIARTAFRDGDLVDLSSLMSTALEGAKIAYGFGVSQQSRDVLKSLSDLRKAVSDETAKLSDSTRSLAAAVMTSAVGNIALVVARLTLNKDARLVAPAAAAIGAALAIYVAVVIWSGWHFLSIQRNLRQEWRGRLYRFLSDDEYELMVATPVKNAERGFKMTAIASGTVAVLMLVAVICILSRSA